MGIKTQPDDHAFPVSGSENDYTVAGLTKREHFAAIALQGLLALPEDEDDNFHYFKTHEDLRRSYCRTAVAYADDLIAALNA